MTAALTSHSKLVGESPSLPAAWTRTTLGEVAEFIMGQAPAGSDCNTEGKGAIFVKAGEFGVTFPVVREWTTHPLKFSQDGDVLICVVGATCGKLNLAINSAIGRSVAAIRPCNGLGTKFLYLQMQPKVLELRASSTGSAQGVLTRGDLGKIDFVVPPLPEQRLIVAEIEKQFTRLDAGVSALRRVQANLKRYRAAVLKAACEGKLVPTEAELAKSRNSKSEARNKFETGEQLLQRILKQRREKWAGKGKYKEPAAPDATGLPKLPEGWCWATAEQLSDESRAITYGVIKLGEDVPDGIPTLRSSDVRHLRLDLEGVKCISPKIAGNYRRTFLEGGEILVTVRGTLGGVVVAPKACKGFNVSREVAMIALVESSVAANVAIFIGSIPVQNWLLQRTRGIAYTGINIATLKALPVPLPPLAEQERIVAEVERRLSVVEELSALVTANLQRATRLRQSILQRAFEGKLVQQEAAPSGISHTTTQRRRAL